MLGAIKRVMSRFLERHPDDKRASSLKSGRSGLIPAAALADDGIARGVDATATNECQSKEVNFVGWPLPNLFLLAIGTRRSGPWMTGFAVAIVVMVVVLGTKATLPNVDQRVVPLLAGAIAGLLVGVLVALTARSATCPATTFPDQEQELRQRAREAGARLAALQLKDDSVARIVETLLRSLDANLGRSGPHWLDGTGFLDAWTTLHESEENLLLIDSDVEVMAAALYDLLRLDNSKIAGKDALTAELKTSLPYLSKAAADQIGVKHAANTNPPVARRRIRCVRMAINEDREQQWDQIVRSRNGLLTTSAFAMGVAYLLVVLGVGFSAGSKAMGSALVFALIGALVSVAHQLLIRSNSQSDVEDFGFSTVKLIVVALLSGMVAVLGVVLLTQIQLTLSGQSLGGSFSSWQTTFDWRKNPSALEVAIIFGLAPSLFFSLVQSRVDSAMDSIKSSQPSGGATK